jgi:hypothetical protein
VPYGTYTIDSYSSKLIFKYSSIHSISLNALCCITNTLTRRFRRLCVMGILDTMCVMECLLLRRWRSSLLIDLRYVCHRSRNVWSRKCRSKYPAPIRFTELIMYYRLTRDCSALGSLVLHKKNRTRLFPSIMENKTSA